MRIEWIRKIFIFVLALFILVAAWESPGVAIDAPPKTDGTIQERIAGMGDEDVRKLLITQMQAESSVKQGVKDEAWGAGAALDKLLHVLNRNSDSTQKELAGIIDNIPLILQDIHRIFVALSADGTRLGAFINILWVLLFVGFGLTAEKITSRILRGKNTPFSADNHPRMSLEEGSMAIADKLTTALVFTLPSFFGLIVFFVTAYTSYFTFLGKESSFLQLIFLAVLMTITIIRVIVILSLSIFSPADNRLRLLPLSCATARGSCRLLVWTWGYIVTSLTLILVVQRSGARPDTVTLLKISAATLLLAVTAGVVLHIRQKITASLLTSSREAEGPPSLRKQYLASIWHFLVLFYLVTLWILMIASVTDSDTPANGAFIFSFFVLPIWLLADQLLQWLVKHAMLSLKLYEESDASQQVPETDNISEQHKANKLFLRVKNYSRLALGMAVVLWVAGLWGYTIPLISKLPGVLFDSLIIMAVALFFWQFISSWIDRKIKESLPEDSIPQDNADDDWGIHTAQGRAYTLSPIIRSFVASTLIIMVTLTILSSLGVDIGPLLAGAGVVGLAIGFGAQKIVADVFSGVFYLIDDAFRVGEYLLAGGISGTVEKISLRNVMLRHHRGMLQIIPYSELGTITNYMRGGIIEKFSLDFPYDADIDKIRKIIKKVGQEMLEDPELGKNFIRPIRSQGVREITNSVMTIRVKFTAQPGSQFIIRREAFARITAAMKARGIQYAHRKVIVDIPAPRTGNEDAGRMENIAQAAGAAAREMFDEEERLKQLMAQEKSGTKKN